MKTLRHALSLRYSILAVGISLCLTARPIVAQNYYPSADAPVDGNAALAFIESMLHNQYRKTKVSGSGTTASPAIFKIQVPSLYAPDSQVAPTLPPLPANDPKNTFDTYSPAGLADHYILATDAELDLALGAAVQKLLDGTAVAAGFSGPNATLANLVSALANYKKTTVNVFVKTATTNILNWSTTFPAAAGGSQTAALESLTAAACEADPSKAAAIVTTMLPLVVPKVKAGLTGAITPTASVQYGAAQISRTEAVPTAVQVQSALNAIPGIMSKGGVTVTNGTNSGLKIQFGSNIVDDVAATDAGLSTALNSTGLSSLGLSGYGQFTVIPDTAAATPVGFQGDLVITFKPLILNIAGGTNRDQVPTFTDAADDIVRKAVEKAAVNAVAIVNSALGVVTAGVDVSGNAANSPTSAGTAAKASLDKAKALTKSVSAAAINSAYANGGAYLGDEVALAIGTKVKGVSYTHKASETVGLAVKRPVALSADIAEAVFTDPTHPTAINEIALIAAGLMKGFKGSIYEVENGVIGGPLINSTSTVISANPPEKNIVDQIKSTLSVEFTGDQGTYLDHVQAGFQTAYGRNANLGTLGVASFVATNAAMVAKNVMNEITGTAGAENYIAARLTGAAAFLPGILTAKNTTATLTLPAFTFTGGNFISNVLQFDADQSGDDGIVDIIEAATRASSANAATVANLATIWAKAPIGSPAGLETQRYGKITRGAALGLKGQPLYNTMLSGVVTKVLAGRGTFGKTTTSITKLPSGPDPTLLDPTPAGTTAASKALVFDANDPEIVGIEKGQIVTGGSIPAGTTVASVGLPVSGKVTVTLSKAVTLGVAASTLIEFRTPYKTAVSLTELGSLTDPNAVADLKEITSYALKGAVDAGHQTAAVAVTTTVAKAASTFYQFYKPILQAAIDPSAGGGGVLSSSEQWRAVLAVMAVKKLTASTEFNGTYNIVPSTTNPATAINQAVATPATLFDLIPAYAATVPSYSNSNDNAITKGRGVIDNLQKFPKAIFTKAFDAFITDTAVGTDDRMTKAVLTGVSLVAPTSTTLATILAVKARPSISGVIETEAIGLSPATAANLKVAVAVAKHVADGTSDIFDYVDTQLFQNSKYLTEIVTAATVVAPQYVHFIGHAVGFRAPTSVAKAVPLLFDYAHLTWADPLQPAPLSNEYDNRVDATAAITAGITAGILEAKTALVSGNSAITTTAKATTEITNLKNAITALVKQSLTFRGNTPVMSPWLPGGGEGPSNFKQSDGSAPVLASGVIVGGFTPTNQLGPAGVVTGFVSQVIKSGDTRLDVVAPTGTDHSVGIVGAVITAAVTVIKGDVTKSTAGVLNSDRLEKLLAIAQAATQAARSVSSVFSSGTPETFTPNPGPAGQHDYKQYGAGVADVVQAVLNAFSSLRILFPFKPDGVTPNTNYVGNQWLDVAMTKPNPYYHLDQFVTNAAYFGLLAANDDNNIPGAGAAGVINYTLHSATGTPVTDIFGL